MQNDCCTTVSGLEFGAMEPADWVVIVQMKFKFNALKFVILSIRRLHIDIVENL